jgi:hypothetical protein
VDGNVVSLGWICTTTIRLRDACISSPKHAVHVLTD